MPDIYQKRNGEVVLVMPDYGDRVSAVETAVAGKAATSHATSDGSNGKASASVFGHAKLSDAVDSSSAAASGIAASAYAVKKAYDAAVSAKSAADAAQTTASTAVTQAQLESAKTEVKGYTDDAVAALVNSAPETLDTLGELATALSDNVEVTDALNEAIGSKANASEVVKLTGAQTIAGTKTFSSTISGSVSGNAGTATKLASAKTITLSGDVSGSVSFDGSDNVTLTATVADDSHNHTIANVDGLQTALDGKANSSHGTHVTFSTTAPKAAGTAAVGTATTVSRSDHVHPAQTTVSGNAGTATKLAAAVTVSLTGDVTGSVDFDGSGDVSITATVADDSHNHTIANVDGLQTALDAKAPLADPIFTGTPKAPTATAGTNSTQIATTAFVTTAVANKTSVSGNAGTATKLAEARTIAISGGATGTATSFDGSANITIPVTALDMSKASAGTLAVARGGTGVTANPSMLVNLASTTAASVFAASPRPGVTGILPVANGGTGNKNGIAPKATADASGNTITTTYATKTELTTAITNTELALTTPITAGSTVTVPSYTVGKGNINVYIDGVRCTRGDTFSEVGTSGAASTSVKFNDAISADYEVIAISG